MIVICFFFFFLFSVLTGIWSRDIRYKSNLPLTEINKILKNLESKKLIKAVKSVAVSRSTMRAISAILVFWLINVFFFFFVSRPLRRKCTCCITCSRTARSREERGTVTRTLSPSLWRFLTSSASNSFKARSRAMQACFCNTCSLSSSTLAYTKPLSYWKP